MRKSLVGKGEGGWGNRLDVHDGGWVSMYAVVLVVVEGKGFLCGVRCGSLPEFLVVLG